MTFPGRLVDDIGLSWTHINIVYYRLRLHRQQRTLTLVISYLSHGHRRRVIITMPRLRTDLISMLR